MAVKRQGNFLGQQRVDIPHLRSIESGVAGDFDSLAGKAMAGSQALVVSGFTLSNVTPGQPVANLLLSVSGGIMLHATASEAGAIFTVAVGTPDETFLATNAKVVGSFAPGTTNYIGLDLIREVDPTTVDSVRFLSTSTDQEYTQSVPLARVLGYSIVVTTTDFSANPNLLPIAKVVTDSSNNIASAVVDCRQMMFRLGTGGTTPAPRAAYIWDDVNRNESLSADVFAGGDKGVGSQAEWNRAVMSRLWELGGGPYWYSPSADRNVKLTGDPGAVFGSGENFEFVADNAHWQGLKFVFGNSTGWYNTITDQLVNNAGGGGVYGAGFTDLTLDGDCLYVDLDRTQNANITTIVKANLANLGTPTIPGSRFVIAWRTFGALWSPLSPFAVGGGGVSHATPVSYGSVKLACSAGNVVAPDDAVVPGYEVNTHTVIARRISRYNASPIGVGAGTLSIGTVAAYDTALSFASTGVVSTFNGAVHGVQGAEFTTSLFNGNGVYGLGSGLGAGVLGVGANATTGPGLLGQGGTSGGVGVRALGNGGGHGGEFTGNGAGHGVLSSGGGTGNGVVGRVGSSGNYGVYGDGTTATISGNGSGVYGVGLGTGHGVVGQGGNSNGNGVVGTAGAGGLGAGVVGLTGANGRYGVYADANGASISGTGLYARGKGSGHGILAFANGGGNALNGTSSTTPAIETWTGLSTGIRAMAGGGTVLSFVAPYAAVEGISTDPSVVGIKAQMYGANPARGALHTVSQTEPTAPSGGDIWWNDGRKEHRHHNGRDTCAIGPSGWAKLLTNGGGVTVDDGDGCLATTWTNPAGVLTMTFSVARGNANYVVNINSYEDGTGKPIQCYATNKTVNGFTITGYLLTPGSPGNITAFSFLGSAHLDISMHGGQ